MEAPSRYLSRDYAAKADEEGTAIIVVYVNLSHCEIGVRIRLNEGYTETVESFLAL